MTGQFKPNKENWPQYIERLEHFVFANNIVDANKQKSILLSVVVPIFYKLLQSLVLPQKPGDKAFEDLVTVLCNHYTQHNWKLFMLPFHQPPESIFTFVSELCTSAE